MKSANLTESLQSALIALHEAESVSDIETQLFKELRGSFQLSWVRIFLQPPQILDQQLERLPNLCFFRREMSVGTAVFARAANAGSRKAQPGPFKKREQEALEQICRSAELAIDRLVKIDQAENLKTQWEATFNAIAEPLCLTDEEFKIVRTNKVFVETAGFKPAQVVGKNCFAVMNSAAEHRQFDVVTQPISGFDEGQKLLLILFRDVTEQKKIEKQIFASAKMAELGTIGSSIAHDINNPLGGMLSFLQLIKADLPEDHSMRADILEMEAAARRCKGIVENLLRFSRQQDADETTKVDLRQVLEQAIQIVELQTRSVGIELTVEQLDHEVQLLGQFNLLSQALSELLQNAYSAVVEKLRQKPGSSGTIRAAIQEDKNDSQPKIEILIYDNGIGTHRRLTLAQQIIDQHGGKIEISSQPNVGTTVKITFLDV